MKRKLLLFSVFLLFVFILPFFSISPKNASAEVTCSVDYVHDVKASKKGEAVVANSDSRSITMRISTTNTARASLLIKPPGKDPYKVLDAGDSLAVFEPNSNNKIQINKLSYIFRGPITFFSLGRLYGAGHKLGDVGEWKVLILDEGQSDPGTAKCVASFNIEQAPRKESDYCDINLDPEEDRFTYLEKIRFSVTFKTDDASTKKDDANYMHRVTIKNIFEQVINGSNSKYSTKDLVEGVELDRRLSDGEYTMEVREKAVDLIFGDEGRSCLGEFIIGENGGAGCAGGAIGDKQCQTLEKGYLCLPATGSARLVCRPPESGEGHNPCTPDSEGNAPFKCQTAIGEISTSPGGFIKSVLVLILSLSGGIIILLIIINGYKLMVSQGDPEKVKEARESVMSAIAGLLLIIFSIVILQFITVDVLHLPGFE